jgi:4-diphosphocytidyl-2-C-methyl-D-erythritol kinase
LILRAPAKLNLCLYLGPRRPDGLHEIRSIFAPLILADGILVEEAEEDEVVCDGVAGPNLAADALAALRRRGWAHPPVRIEIEKRIPVAAGLGGGSADAAAVLRLARGEIDGLEEIAAELGADVPSQLDPGLMLVGGAGEELTPLRGSPEVGVVVIPGVEGLATGDVYTEADRLGLGRSDSELAELSAHLRAEAATGVSPLRYADLLRNDLEPATLSLRPDVGDALDALRLAGAEVAMVAGSGPTAVGLFGDVVAADRAAASLPPAYAEAFVTSTGGSP